VKFNIWLDDIREPPDGWILVKTVPQLIHLILGMGNQVETISLDHDLGEDTPSGYVFISWLEKQVHDGVYSEIPKIRVHSKNPVGRKRMEAGIRAICKKIEDINM